MSVRDVSSVFGRYFIVGFFLPAFFWLSYLKLTGGSAVVPHQVQGDTAGAFAVVGIAALLLGLFLQGVRLLLVRLFSGYWVMSIWRSSEHHRLREAAGVLRRLLRWKALREYDRLVALAAPGGPQQPGEDADAYRTRRLAEYWLGQRFPDTRDKVLPTKFGNRIRAWEDYARTRWSLETVSIRPHVEMMLGQQETDLRTDTETDLAFAVNASLLGAVVALTLGVDRAVQRPHSLWFIAACFTPVILAVVFYEIAVVAAVAWGNVVRATIDVHRLDLYDKLGVRRPSTANATCDVGSAINRMLLYGDALPDAVRATPEPSNAGPPPDTSTEFRHGLCAGAGLVTAGVLASRILACRRRARRWGDWLS